MNVKSVLDSLNLHQIRTNITTHYHRKGPVRHPLNPQAILKAQLAKHLLNIISDRRLALQLRNDHKVARARGFLRQTQNHGIFTHFRHRLGEETYTKVFNELTRSHRSRQHPPEGLQRPNHGQPKRQKRPGCKSRTWKKRIRPRIPSPHRLLRRLRAANRLHCGSIQRERQGLLRASTGEGAPPCARVPYPIISETCANAKNMKSADGR